MTVNLSALAGAGQQFFDNNGNPLSGGKLWSYQAGTTTPQTTYTTASGNVAHTNPIVLDSAGRVATGQIWLTLGSNYKFTLMTSVNVTLATWDNITGINGTGITSNASNVDYDPAGTGAVATTVQTKLRESASILDFGLDQTAVNTWLTSGIEVAKVTELINITTNTHIDSSKTVQFENGGGFNIANGVTLTIDAQIQAGDNQIFFCAGTGKVVCTNNGMGNPAYPIRTPHIKAIWFGVIPDAIYPTSFTIDPTYATVTLGQTPVGTDSTEALKMAVQYVQLNCVKAAAFVYAVTAPILHLPSGQVLVKGNNVLGNQFETAEMDSYYAIADAGGDAETPSGTYRKNNYNFILEGNDCQLLWMVQTGNDILWDSGFLVNRIEARNFHVNPINTVDIQGVFFRNKALTTYGTITNFANALGPAIFDNVNVVNNIVATTAAGPSNFQYRLKYIFWNEGYSRCDNFTVRCGFFNGFNIFWKGDNPEAVDLRFENNMIYCDKAGSTVFQFSSFYDGFIASGNFFSFKAANQTLLQEINATTQYIGASYFSNCRYFFPGGNRYEFIAGLTGFTMYKGYASLAIFEGFNIGIGGLPASAQDALIDYQSSVIFKDSFCAGGYQITSSSRQQSLSAPRVTYDNCGFFLFGGISGYSVDTGSGYEIYRNAISSAVDSIPAVRYTNQRLGRNSLPYPEYYGTWNGYETKVLSTTAIERNSSGNSCYGSGTTNFLFPPLVKITSILLNTRAGSFTSLQLRFGNGASGKPTYTLTTALAGTAQQALELMPADKCIMLPSNDTDYLQMLATVLNGASPVVGGILGWLTFSYEAVENRQNIVPILGTEVAALVDNQ